MKAKIKSYQDAIEYLNGKKERPYAHNTRIIIDSLNLGHEVITVTYHGNGIVNFFPDGTVTYNSCGWKTPTTKERINWFLPVGFSLYQEKSVWYLVDRGQDWHGDFKTGRYVFADGIALKNRVVYNAGQEDQAKPLIKAIKKFVDGYVKALLDGEVKEPDGGDCWYCYFQNDEGKPLGTGNTGHLESHFEDSYYVPSLLVNAYKHFDEMNHSRMSPMSKDGVARLWKGESLSDWHMSIVARDVKSCLTAYIKHEFGLPS